MIRMKNNSRLIIYVSLCCAAGAFLGYLNKKEMKKEVKSNSLTISNYVNRLKEFDLTSNSESINFFYDLVEIGFHPNSAFDLARQESIEASEFFND